MHCGYLDEREWLTAQRGDGNASVPARVGATGERPGVEWQTYNPETDERWPQICPGWAVRQPLIVDICRAHQAFDKGALEALEPDIANTVAEGVQELARAFAEYHRQRMMEVHRSAERG
jgi:hypothetical protein